MFYAGWVLDGTKIGCPVTEPVLYLGQMRIKEVVFTVYLGLWGCVCWVLLGLVSRIRLISHTNIDFLPNTG